MKIMPVILLAALPLLAQGPSPLSGRTVNLWNPFPDPVPQIVLAGTAFDLTVRDGNWLKLEFNSLGSALGFHMSSFHFQTRDFILQFARQGLGGSQEFNAEDFAGGKEIWIMVDPSGPATAPPVILTAAPRRLRLLNPWPVNGPAMMLDGARKGMLVDRSHCGWYEAYLLAPGAAKAHFVNTADGETWGTGGFGDASPFDLAAAFGTGREIWIGAQGKITSTFPGTEGVCGYLMAATVHDMARSHPDYNATGNLTMGMVAKTLGPDRKPVPVAAPANFATWFNSDPAKPMPLKGAETCVDIPMGKSDDGLWEYDSYHTPAKGYFPIDDFNKLDANTSNSCYQNPVTGLFTTTGQSHNFGFCMESHASFIYRKGQVFEFRGDDDVWVFIDGKLRLDLGGVHVATPGAIDLDTLGLEEGKEYPWDFFFCERKECASSLRIKTTIYFRQQRALDHVEERQADGSVRYRIVKREGGTGSCGSATGTTREVAPTALVYTLLDPAGTALRDLPEGTSYGGIRIATPQVDVDTARIAGLAPGRYRIVFHEPGNAKVQDELAFTVTARNRVELDPPYKVTALLGTAVPVVAANRLQGALVPQADAYTPVIPAGLSVYEDAALARKAAPGAALRTGPDGLDTLWLAGDPAATEDRTYPLTLAGSGKRIDVTFTLPTLDLPRASWAAVFDDDADGIADRLRAAYDRDIAANLPLRIEARWPATAGPLSLARANLAPFLAGRDTLEFRGAALAPALPAAGGVLTEGEGTFASAYPARGRDSVQIIPVQDRIAPILLHAEMALGLQSDTLRLRFSEPLSPASFRASGADLFVYRASPGGPELGFTPRALVPSADRLRLELIFPPASAPRAGYQVRFATGPNLAADGQGNAPGPNTRFRLITGVKRADISTVPYKTMDPALAVGPVVRASREPLDAEVKSIADRTGLMGHLIKVDLGDYAQGDDFHPIDPATVSLEYHVAYFTNHAVPVASAQRKLSCSDPLYQGDCRLHRGNLFLGWNAASASGQKVATGAYVARVRYHVTVAGRPVASGALDQVWGVLRTP